MYRIREERRGVSNTDEGNGIEREIHTPQGSDIRSAEYLQICTFSACMTSMAVLRVQCRQGYIEMG